jgi:uncharacterized membrane protein YccC
MNDPGLRGLRRAGRTTITASLAFYTGLYIVDDAQFAVLAVFACIGVNGLADFGGPSRSRFLANAAMILTGVPLVVLGTLVSETTVEATLLMFAVVFVIGYMSIYSGYLAAGANVVTLFFVVASAIPAEASAIDSRVLGLLFGGAIAAPASVLLWPLYERATFRLTLGKTMRTVSEAITNIVGSDAEWNACRDKAHTHIAALRPTLAQLTLRPAGPTSHDRAEIYLVYALDRLDSLLNRLEPCRPQLGEEERARQLARLASTLEISADAIEEKGGPPDLGSLRAANEEFARGSNARLEQAISDGIDPQVFGSDADADLTLRELGIVTGVVAVNVSVAVGAVVPSAALGSLPAPPGLSPASLSFPQVAWRRARANFTLRSVAMRNTLRLAVGLSLARLLVGLFDLQHGFWVVFGTLTVMKSSAGGTRQTVIKAVSGTAIGFAVAAVMLTLLEGDSDVWVVLMPITLFGAMYISGRNLVIGQALFTTTIVFLFRIMAPANWTLALLRLEDVALGAGVGLLIGVLAWPRGAGGQLRSTLADLLDKGRRYTTLAARSLLAGTAKDKEAELASVRSDMIGATHRVEDVFTQYLTEVGQRRVPLPVWGDLLASGLRLWYTTDTVMVHASDTSGVREPVCPSLAGFLEQAADQLDVAFGRAAAALRAGTSVTLDAPFPPDTVVGPYSSECITALRGETDRERLDRFMHLIEVRAWMRVLDEDLVGLPEPIGEVAAALGPSSRPGR